MTGCLYCVCLAYVWCLFAQSIRRRLAWRLSWSGFTNVKSIWCLFAQSIRRWLAWRLSWSRFTSDKSIWCLFAQSIGRRLAWRVSWSGCQRWLKTSTMNWRHVRSLKSTASAFTSTSNDSRSTPIVSPLLVLIDYCCVLAPLVLMPLPPILWPPEALCFRTLHLSVLVYVCAYVHDVHTYVHACKGILWLDCHRLLVCHWFSCISVSYVIGGCCCFVGFSYGPKEPCFRLGFMFLHGKGRIEGDIYLALVARWIRPVLTPAVDSTTALQHRH